MHGHPTLSLEGKKDSWGSCGLQLRLPARGTMAYVKNSIQQAPALAGTGSRVIKSNKDRSTPLGGSTG